MNGSVIASGAIPLLALLTGWLTWTRLPAAADDRENALERLFAIVVCGLAATGMLGLLLAELGMFRPWTVALGLFAAAAALGLRRRRLPAAAPLPRRDALAALVVAAVGVATLAPASEDLLGGRDPGIYANIGSWLAREGTLRVYADALPTIAPETREIFYPAGAVLERRSFLPAFFVVDAATGELVAQFLHLLSVFMAMGYWLGGTAGALLVPPALAVLAELAVFLFARRMLGVGAALVTAGLLATNLAQIWAGRNPYTEGGTQLGIFAALWCVAGGARSGGARWGVVGGLAVGMALLMRIDSLLALSALVPALVVLRASAGGRQGWIVYALLPISVLAALWSTLHAWLFARPYLLLLSRSVRPLWTLTILVLLLSIVALATRPRVERLLNRVSTRGTALWTGISLVLVAAFAFGLWVRPSMEPFSVGTSGERTFNEETLVRMAWYVSVPGLLLGFAGVLMLLHGWLVRRRVEWTPFLGVVLAFSLLYFWKQLAYPDHPWAMRRYLPVVVPGLYVGMAAAASGLWRVRGRPRIAARGLATATIGAALLHQVTMLQPFWNLREKSGTLVALDRLAALVPEDAVVLFTRQGADSRLTTPLALHLGHKVMPVLRIADDSLREGRRPRFEAQIARWLQESRPVFYLTVDDGNAPFATHGLEWHAVGAIRLTYATFGTSAEHAPRSPVIHDLLFHLLRATPGPNTPAPCAPQWMQADAVLLGSGQGLYGVESDRGTRFRWTMPSAGVVFPACDRSGGRPGVVRVRAACDRVVRQGDCRVAVTVNGAAAGTMALTQQWGIHDVAVPDDAVTGHVGPVVVRFEGSGFVPAHEGRNRDRRVLSFQLASVALVAVGGTTSSGGRESVAATRPATLNLLEASARFLWGVEQDGFYGLERTARGSFRWTERVARLVVPLEGRRPDVLRLEVARGARAGQAVKISASGCLLFDGVVPHANWAPAFSLGSCDRSGGAMTILIESEAVRPRGDRRELGIALRHASIE